MQQQYSNAKVLQVTCSTGICKISWHFNLEIQGFVLEASFDGFHNDIVVMLKSFAVEAIFIKDGLP